MVNLPESGDSQLAFYSECDFVQIDLIKHLMVLASILQNIAASITDM